jgi:hypothetical protein
MSSPPVESPADVTAHASIMTAPPAPDPDDDEAVSFDSSAPPPLPSSELAEDAQKATTDPELPLPPPPPSPRPPPARLHIQGEPIHEGQDGSDHEPFRRASIGSQQGLRDRMEALRVREQSAEPGFSDFPLFSNEPPTEEFRDRLRFSPSPGRDSSTGFKRPTRPASKMQKRSAGSFSNSQHGSTNFRREATPAPIRRHESDEIVPEIGVVEVLHERDFSYSPPSLIDDEDGDEDVEEQDEEQGENSSGIALVKRSPLNGHLTSSPPTQQRSPSTRLMTSLIIPVGSSSFTSHARRNQRRYPLLRPHNPKRGQTEYGLIPPLRQVLLDCEGDKLVHPLWGIHGRWEKRKPLGSTNGLYLTRNKLDLTRFFWRAAELVGRKRPRLRLCLKYLERKEKKRKEWMQYKCRFFDTKRENRSRWMKET